MLNLVDSSGWLEYLSDGQNADFFTKPLQDTENLIVPTICLYEVFKVVMRERSEDEAIQAIGLMKQAETINLTTEIAIQAAKNSYTHQIPMADSIILTTGQLHHAVIWTQDKDFEPFKDVKFIHKK